MKLLFVIDSLVSGGAQRQMTLLVSGLAARGHDVDLYLYYPQYNYFLPEVEAAGVKVLRGAKRRRFDLEPIRAIAKLMRQSTYDAAVAFLNTPSLYLVAAGIFSRPRRLIVSERLSSRQTELSWRERLKVLPYRIADVIVSNSHIYANQLGQAVPSLARRVAVISNAVPPAFFKIPAISTPGEPLSLLCLGRVGYQKNPATLAAAMVLLRSEGFTIPHVRWVGRREDSGSELSYIAAVEKTILAEGLMEHWQWLGERKDILQLFENSDGLILPSFFEGTPNAVCEAMAAGRPVIASTAGDTALLVEDGHTGFLFDPHSARSLAEAMKRFLRLNPSERRRMGDNARVFACEHLSMERFISQWESVLRGNTMPNRNREGEH